MIMKARGTGKITMKAAWKNESDECRSRGPGSGRGGEGTGVGAGRGEEERDRGMAAVLAPAALGSARRCGGWSEFRAVPRLPRSHILTHTY